MRRLFFILALTLTTLISTAAAAAPSSASSSSANPFAFTEPPPGKGVPIRREVIEAKELRKKLAEAQAKVHAAEIREAYEDGRSTFHILLGALVGSFAFGLLLLAFIGRLREKIGTLAALSGKMDEKFERVLSIINKKDEELAILRCHQPPPQ